MRGFPSKDLYLNDNPSTEPIELVVTDTPFKRERVEIRFTDSIWDKELPERGTVFYLNFETIE